MNSISLLNCSSMASKNQKSKVDIFDIFEFVMCSI